MRKRFGLKKLVLESSLRPKRVSDVCKHTYYIGISGNKLIEGIALDIYDKLSLLCICAYVDIT